MTVVTQDFDLTFLTGGGVDDGLEPGFLALGRGPVGTAVGAAHGLIRRVVRRLKEHGAEHPGQGRRSDIGLFLRSLETQRLDVDDLL